jgi:HAD superfamily hydrolase (TIGR01509 family)
LQLLPGLTEFLAAAHARGIALAIGSAAIPFNIDFVVDGLELRSYFPTIVSADDVTLSKPHPETFLKAAQLLGVAPADCLVFEDVPKGVEAAARAGMDAVVLTTTHPASDFAGLANVRHFAPDFTDAFFQTLL